MNNNEEDYYHRKKRPEITLQKISQKMQSTTNCLLQKRQTKTTKSNIYRGFQCHVTHGKFRRKYDKPQGRKKRVAVGYSRTLTGGNRSNWHIYQRHEVKIHRVKLSNT